MNRLIQGAVLACVLLGCQSAHAKIFGHRHHHVRSYRVAYAPRVVVAPVYAPVVRPVVVYRPAVIAHPPVFPGLHYHHARKHLYRSYRYGYGY